MVRRSILVAAVVLVLSSASACEHGSTEVWVAVAEGWSSAPAQVRVFRPSTGSERVLLEDDGWLYSNPVWSPDGRYLAVVAHPSPVDKEVHFFRANGWRQSTVRLQPGTGLGYSVSVAWSPDSSRVAVADAGAFVLLTPDGKEVASDQDLRPATRTGSDERLIGVEPTRWSADSRYVAVGVGGSVFVADRNGRVTRVDAEALSGGIALPPVPVMWIEPRTLLMATFTRPDSDGTTPQGRPETHAYTVTVDGASFAAAPMAPDRFDALLLQAYRPPAEPELVAGTSMVSMKLTADGAAEVFVATEPLETGLADRTVAVVLKDRVVTFVVRGPSPQLFDVVIRR